MKDLLTAFYCLPLWASATSVMVMLLLWFTVMCLARQRKRLVNTISGCALLAALLVIVAATLLSRQKGNYTVCFALLSRFRADDFNLDTTIRPMLMNTFLFLPFGMSLSYVLPEKTKLRIRVMLVIASAFLLSLFLETAQYCLSIGNFETNDILCNTVGALLGTVPLAIQSKAVKKSNPR